MGGHQKAYLYLTEGKNPKTARKRATGERRQKRVKKAQKMKKKKENNREHFVFAWPCTVRAVSCSGKSANVTVPTKVEAKPHSRLYFGVIKSWVGSSS